jgi:transcriptional regulator with XRE-family HTH domain
MDLKKRLGVSERVIEEATGISHSTLQYWKRNRDAQPRAGSEGGLWALMSAVDDIEAHLGHSKTVAAWLKERRERVTALKAGRLRRLVDRETGVLRTADTAVVTIEVDEAIEAAETAVTEAVEERNTGSESWALDGPAPRIVLD